MVRAVFFDLDDTMYPYTEVDKIARERLSEYCSEQFGISGEDFRFIHKKAFDDINRDTLIDTPARHNRIIRYMRILELLDAPLYPHALTMYDLYWDTILGNMKAEPGLIELMDLLKKLGFFIGVGSNMTAHVQLRKLDRLGALPYIDRAVFSEETVVQKPHPMFFLQLCQKAGFDPFEVLFIGDSMEHDVEPPIRLGMKAALYDPGNIYDPSVHEIQPDCVIKSFADCVRGDRAVICGIL